MRSLLRLAWCGVAIVASLASGCARQPAEKTVVVYVALDQTFSEPVLAAFESETGINVLPVFDVEATKTVGLMNRLIAEKNRPQCDVFWNNEVVRTIVLQKKGLLEPYRSPSAADIPAAMVDPAGHWAGFAARARILICNTETTRSGRSPESIRDLVKPAYRGKCALAYPLFGTTSTHAAALFAYWGRDVATNYYNRLKENGVIIVDGNATVKDMVARGEVPVGFTDTDDAQVALAQGKPVRMVFPDQGEDQMGTLAIPNTVALIANCPHPEEARLLIDFLLSRRVEEMLAHSGSAQMPVRDGVAVPEGNPSLAGIKTMEVDWFDVEAHIQDVSLFMGDLFVR